MAVGKRREETISYYENPRWGWVEKKQKNKTEQNKTNKRIKGRMMHQPSGGAPPPPQLPSPSHDQGFLFTLRVEGKASQSQGIYLEKESSVPSHQRLSKVKKIFYVYRNFVLHRLRRLKLKVKPLSVA